MPDTKISALTAGDPALSTDAIPIARGGANFKVTAGSIAALSPAGTVTSVGGTGTVNGITLTGTVTSSGSLTLGGALSGVSLTTQVSGTLPTANGGTNLTSFTSGGAVYATSSSALTTGTLPTASGGTNLTSFTSGGAVYATSTSALTTGTLPLASGGTGQTTKAAAFNALSPVTSTGDLILGNGVNSNTRLPIGTNGYVLTSNGTTASWQAGGGGGGVTSFDGGFTGLGPYSATTGAVSLSGTLNVGSGGTGTTSSPSNGQLLIGSGSVYTVATLTAGAGISITNGSGSITIAASGPAGPTISILSMSTTSGSFNNIAPSSTYSYPLIGYTAFSPSYYGAFFFKNFSGAYFISSGVSISSMSITNSTGTTTSYTSGTDFSSSPFTFNVYDDIVACYGLSIYNAGMQTLFSDSKNAIAIPSLAPLNASSAFSFSNPSIFVNTSSGSYSNQSGQRGVVISKSGASYYVELASADPTSAFPTVTSISLTINGSSSSYSNSLDFNVTFAENNVNGRFNMGMTVSNATLQTLFDNSFLP